MQLRPYQSESLNRITSAFQSGITRQLLSLPTGTGKTVIFANLPTVLREILPGKILVLAHTEELIDQAADKLRRWNPGLHVSVEMAERHADPAADIIVASVPTLGRAGSTRYERFDWNAFSCCVCDEAHHATSDTYLRVFERGGFPGSNKLLIGFTATSERGDGVPLGDVFDEVVYDYGLFDAIRDGWLCDLTACTVRGGGDLSKVHTRAGDFAEGELNDEVNTVERNARIVRAWREKAEGRSTLAFCVRIQHAIDLAETFRHFGVRAAAVWGDDPQRAEKIEQLRTGEIDVLCNCAVLTEGFDCWRVSCIVLARPTKSPLLYRQMIGRGTRIQPTIANLKEAIEADHPFIDKRDCLILDIVDNCGRHELCTAASLIGLPQEAEAHGQSLSETKALLDLHPDINFAGVRDLSNVDMHIESFRFVVDETGAVPSELRFAMFSWKKVGPRKYVLPLPDRKFVRIQQNQLDKWDTHYWFDPSEPHETFDDLKKAVLHLEEYVKSEVSAHHLHILDKNAKWRKGKPTENQLATLRKVCPHINPAGLTKGQVSDILSAKFARRGAA